MWELSRLCGGIPWSWADVSKSGEKRSLIKGFRQAQFLVWDHTLMTSQFGNPVMTHNVRSFPSSTPQAVIDDLMHPMPAAETARCIVNWNSPRCPMHGDSPLCRFTALLVHPNYSWLISLHSESTDNSRQREMWSSGPPRLRVLGRLVRLSLPSTTSGTRSGYCGAPSHDGPESPVHRAELRRTGESPIALVRILSFRTRC